MRIVIIAQQFPYKNRPDRCSFLLDQALRLNDLKDVDVFVIAPRYRFLPLKKYSTLINESNSMEEIQSIGSLTIYRPYSFYFPGPLRFLNVFSFIHAIKNVIRKKIKSIDLIHAHFAHFAGYAGMRLREIFKIPLVITVHGSDINRYILQNTKEQYHKQRAIKALSGADAIVAVSSDIALKVARLGDFSNKIHRIYNGISFRQFKPCLDKLALREKISLPNRNKLLLFVGNIIKEKGIFEFVDALNILKGKRNDITAVFIGNDGTGGEFEKRIKGMKHVSYIGSVAHDKIHVYFQMADLLVHPSYSEGFGLVLAESLACGCPVVSTNVAAIPEIISSPDLGVLVEPENSEQLAQAIIKAFNQKWDTQLLITHAQQFSIETQINTIHDLYKTLISLVKR